MAIELAKAYVQIVPTTDGIKDNITKELGGDLESAGSKGGASWGGAFSKFATAALTAVTATITAAGTAVVGITKAAVESYADYEQLAGGVETLFGTEQANAVIENARRAFETAGLSANAYMETVTGFSASLMQSLGGDTEKAVGYADRALRDMSDNANKMGTSMESIQNAYQGFAKGNMTMLDNLKLGYGGTKEEMRRLIKDASEMTASMEELGITVDKNDESFGNIVNAISVVQNELGITGTTALEANTTISGSLNSMKAAWTNVLTSMAADNGTFEQAIDDFVNTIVGKNEGEGVIAQIIPRIEKTLLGIGDLVTKLSPIIAEKIPPMIESVAPTLLLAIQSLLTAVSKSLPMMIKAITKVMPELLDMTVKTLLELTPMLIDCALELVYALADGLEQALPVLVPPTMEMLIKVSDTIINNLDKILNCAFRILGALVDGLVEASPMLLDQGAKLIVDVAKSIEDTLWTVVVQGTNVIDRLIKGIEDKMPELKEVAKGLPTKIRDEIIKENYKITGEGTNLAVDLLTGLENGITKMLGEGNWVSNVINKIINAIKNTFKKAWENVDLFYGVDLPTVPVSVNTVVQSTAASTTNYVPNGAPSTVSVDVNIKQDQTKTYKATVSQSYTTSKASGIPSSVMSKLK